MSNDFERVTAAKTQEVHDFIQPPGTTKEVEQYLKKTHALEYGKSQVRYLFNPEFFRRDAIDFQKLVTSLSQKYELEFQVPEMVKLAARQQAQDPASVTANDRLKEALESNTGLLFLDGLLKYQDKGEDIERVIRIVNVHSQNLRVTVDGTTREAEFVAERIACDLLDAQHMKPARESFFRHVAGKQYVSATTLRLGTSIDALFSKELKGFVSKTVEGDLGWKTAVLPTAPNEKNKDDFVSRCAFRTLEFSLSVYDKTSGDHDTSDLVIGITDKRWLGSDLITIGSKLNTDDHLVLVRNLVRDLTGK